MTNPKIEELLLLSDEDIDYSILSEETLIKLVLSDEFFIATSALSELSARGASCIKDLSMQILTGSLGDRYLQAYALEVLYRESDKDAFDYIKKNVDNCDEYILNTIMELITYDLPKFEKIVVDTVHRRIQTVDVNSRSIDPEIRATFLKMGR